MTSCAADRLIRAFRGVFTGSRRGASLRKRRSAPRRLEILESREVLSTGSGVWSFASAPGLHPMKVNVLRLAAGASRTPVFVAPYDQSPDPSLLVGQTGPLIVDRAGNPIWFKPMSSNNSVQVLDFQTQTLRGKPVLVWWQGQIAGITPSKSPAGMSVGGHFVIYDQHYRPIASVKPPGGSSTDLHEMIITPRGTAYFFTTKIVKADLTAYGGPKNGSFVNPILQEVNLRTGQRIFSWNMAQHVPLGDSLVPAPTTADQKWDPYHVNSIDVSADGSQLLVSTRNTWAITDISRKTGQILWQLGGKRNQFNLPANLVTGPFNSAFQFQHDARFTPGGISLYDNAGLGVAPYRGPYGPARGLILNLNVPARTATAAAAPYVHSPALVSNSQGNFQVLANGNTFVGWGSVSDGTPGLSSYYTEYAPDGSAVADYSLAGNNISYRAFTQPWVGLPLTKPSLAIAAANGVVTVGASWNGSTETASWQLLAGASRRSLVPVAGAVRTGFETTFSAATSGPFYAVRALDASGAVLGTSTVVRAG
ncbi:arylsulfotransferase family protein [Aquisphaera insulae]|uniref:arylsulfotransferase family protein n=1 Tax=Aquisphaera insulae TaxID=2712864 RepID=UPI0013EA2E6A|nr:arylsulfotransferase family protein [Aquisphaera insulae]